MAQRGQCMLKCKVHRSLQLSTESIAKDLQTSCGLQISTTVCRKLHGMGFHGQTAAVQSAVHSVRCSCVNRATTGF
ncbi:unnamed protein product [Staurois parvus]|uniref:Transposase Tc1-like domain-containing protein n=1 Tax=Staurois parvus TaxID=386267 RepID=A0ABN9GEY9_9NEOB|nr:unnamed protein product [Staurois parvus]